MNTDTLQTTLNVSGHVELKLYNENNELIDERSIKNIVTYHGRSVILCRYLAVTPLATTGGDIPRYLSLGTGTTTPAVGDTSLTELGSITARVDAGAPLRRAYNNVDVTGTSVTGTVNHVNQVIWKGTFAAGNGTNAAITEAGIFTAATGGLLFARCTFAAINKSAGSRLDIYWGLTIS